MFHILSDTEKLYPDHQPAWEPDIHAYHPQVRHLVTQPLAFPKDQFHGRGIVTAAGGRSLFSSAYIQLHRLRQMECRLPVEVWYRSASEMTPYMRQKLEAIPGVRCIDAYEFQRRHPDTWPATPMNGFELKPYAILHSQFREVIFIDADNVPTRDPSYLLDDEAYQDTGAIFWPDRYRGGGVGAQYRSLHDDAWRAIGLDPRDEAEFETGQIVIDKQRCWRALNLTVYLNQQSDFFYRWMHGDKDTFNLAWHRVDQTFAMPSRPVEQPEGTGPAFYQYDMQGQRIFQHRVNDKWDVSGPNAYISSYVGEAECHELKEQLQQEWPGTIRVFPWDYTPGEREVYARLMETPIHVYGKSELEAADPEAAVPFAQEKAVDEAHGAGKARPLELCPDFTIGRGQTRLVTRWSIEPTHRNDVQLVLGNDARDMAHMVRTDEEIWAGRQVNFRHVPVALAPPRMVE